MTPEQKALVQQSWQQVEPIAPQAAELFYNTLFTMDPSVKPLFKGDMKEQGEKLMSMITSAVNMLDRLDELVPVVQRLGKRHVDYGVKDEHYQTVGAALLDTLEKGLGDGFTPAVKEAWVAVYGVLSSTMIDAASDTAAVNQS